MSKKSIAVAVSILALVVIWGGVVGPEVLGTKDATSGESMASPNVTIQNSSGDISEYPEYISDGVSEKELVNSHLNKLTTGSFIGESSRVLELGTSQYTENKKAWYNGSHTLINIVASDETWSVWANSSSRYYQYRSGDSPRYQVKNKTIPPANPLFLGDLRSIVLGLEYTHTGYAEIGGEPVAVLKSQSVSDSKVLLGRGDVESASATLYVTQNGTIRLVNYSVVRIVDNNEVERNGFLAYSHVGKASVPIPNWIADARDTGVRISASSTEKYHALTLVSGEKIPKGTSIVVQQPSGKTSQKLSESVEPGEAIYVYRKDGSVQVSVNKPENSRAISRGFVSATSGGTIFKVSLGMRELSN